MVEIIIDDLLYEIIEEIAEKERKSTREIIKRILLKEVENYNKSYHQKIASLDIFVAVRREKEIPKIIKKSKIITFD